MDKNLIENLQNKVKQAQEAYYNLDPIMSDEEYDALIEELKKINPLSNVVVSVGATPPRDSMLKKVVHRIPMGSLNKATSEEEISRWVLTTKSRMFHACHKIDGCSLEVIYKNGILDQAVTRGDGLEGEDVTHNALHIQGIPKSLQVSGDLIVRGEVVMHKDVFESKFSANHANPRNTATGKLRDTKSTENDAKHLKFYAFWLHQEGTSQNSHDEMHQRLNSYGFSTPLNSITGTQEEVQAYFIDIVSRRASIPYEIDGVVVSVNDMIDHARLGEDHMRPNGSIAYKFPPSMESSRVLDVKWTVGPTGRVSPVAVIEPVNIGGVVIKNVSLQNLKMFRDLKLFKNCRVLVTRRNDVIPYLAKNLDLEDD